MAKKFTTNALLVLTLIATIACGKKDMNGSGNAIQSSVIIGEIDWKETESLAASSREASNARAVGKINLPWADSRCTAFLIAEDIIMTNHHCIEQASHAQGVTATFDLVEGSVESQRQYFDCSEFIGNNAELDFALLRCEGSPGSQYGIVNLAASAASAGSDLYVIHQNCDYYNIQDCEPTKKISKGKLVSIRSEDGEYVHNADTLGGSSGSPVFGPNHQVIAIHHAGAGGWFNGRGYENYAVPMHKIVEKIRTIFPSVLGTSDSSPSQPQPDQTAGLPVIKKGLYYKGTVAKGLAVKAVFKQTQTSTVKVEVEIDQAAGDLDLYLLDSAGKTVAKSNGTTKLEKITKSLTAGTYTVVVLGYKDAVGSFKLNVSEL